MEIQEIKCKSALSVSKLSEYTYALNPYRGCAHKCIYCYAPYVLRETRRWGDFVDVKINIHKILEKEVRVKRKGVVGISTVTDPYQPVEREYELTRKCLMILQNYNFPVSIQTKSSLILRDIDIITKFEQIDVGITITAINDSDRKKYELNSSPIDERLDTLSKLSSYNIDTWAFIGPVIPHITDKNIEKMIKSLKNVDVKTIIIDKFRFKLGMEKDFEKYSQDETYYCRVKFDIFELCKRYNIAVRDAFSHHSLTKQ